MAVFLSYSSRDRLGLDNLLKALRRAHQQVWFDDTGGAQSSNRSKPESERRAVASVLAIMRNVSVPFGGPYGEFGIYNTEYRTVRDLTNRVYFFELSTSPSAIWVQLDKLDLTEGTQPQTVDPYGESLSRNVTGRFAPRQIAL